EPPGRLKLEPGEFGNTNLSCPRFTSAAHLLPGDLLSSLLLDQVTREDFFVFSCCWERHGAASRVTETLEGTLCSYRDSVARDPPTLRCDGPMGGDLSSA
ncbi:hypothetical protein JOQ06_021320, partial [Pogonophryne albipinna]